MTLRPTIPFICALARAALAGLPLTATALNAAPPAWHVTHHEGVLGTSLELRFSAPGEKQAALAEVAALAEIERLGKILSGYDATSEFRRWLATRDVPQRVSPELFEVLALFDTWRDRTGGALDAAAEVAGRVWKNAARDQRIPTDDELAAAVVAVRQPHWRLDPVERTATHLSDAPLMLNSFAKSYIIDRACSAALAAGSLTTAVVNLGGDIVTRGATTTAVGIADPIADGENDEPLTTLIVRDRAVATSGGYRRGVEILGHWYSHLLDPRTGRPVDHVRSATVVSPRATDAGALATALCVLGAEDGLRLAATVPETECLLVLADGRQVSSPGWSKNELPRHNVHGAVAAIPPAGGADVVGTADGSWDAAFELAVNFELATPAGSGPGRGGEGGKGRGGKGGRGAKRPFVAVWIENKEHFPVRTVALWYHGNRWLPDLRAWSRADQLRASAEHTQIAETIASATRSPGKYTVKWDGKDAAGRPVPRGTYTVFLEVVREHGTHQLLKREIDFAGPAQRFEFPANAELAAASFDFRQKPAGR